ncbi:hypothetical protein KUCAC02_016866 [Chaenocephalus aceratus]|nr:hypothetical protein KUCAC02_016866 [Chaenocephalus aceratus]
MVWLEEDHDGQPTPTRRRTGEKRKRSSATGCFIPITHPCCVCATGQTSVSAGKEIILIGINGRYNLFLPQIKCPCGKTWSIGLGDLAESGYWPATVHVETLYAVDLFTTYEDLKIAAPGMSRQAFVSMLEHRTELFGRLSTRWKPCGFLDGVFLAKDAEVSSFVDYIHGTTRHNPAKGRCGSGQWSAANKSASKLDEEGVERVASHCPELQNLLNMRPFLSITHAKALSWLCELRRGGRNQKGAGNTQEAGTSERQQTLAKRYMKTVQRITEDLEKLTAELQSSPSSSIRDVSPRKKLKKKNPQHFEGCSHKIVEESSHKIVGESSHKIVEESSHKIVGESSHKIVGESSHKIVEESSHKIVGESSHKIVGESSHKIVEESSHKIVEESSHKIVEESSHKIVGESSHKIVGESSHKIVEESSHKIVGESSHKIVGESSHKIVGESSHKIVGESSHKIVGESSTTQ